MDNPQVQTEESKIIFDRNSIRTMAKDIRFLQEKNTSLNQEAFLGGLKQTEDIEKAEIKVEEKAIKDDKLSKEREKIQNLIKTLDLVSSKKDDVLRNEISVLEEKDENNQIQVKTPLKTQVLEESNTTVQKEEEKGAEPIIAPKMSIKDAVLSESKPNLEDEQFSQILKEEKDLNDSENIFEELQEIEEVKDVLKEENDKAELKGVKEEIKELIIEEVKEDLILQKTDEEKIEEIEEQIKNIEEEEKLVNEKIKPFEENIQNIFAAIEALKSKVREIRKEERNVYQKKSEIESKEKLASEDQKQDIEKERW
ncbi:MAG: hypothetical protein PHY30_01100, partial [Candidatus Pacebacteria bacterium]|nr:hypothetical protein [Candidatus Paceibacterota bacterium]